MNSFNNTTSNVHKNRATNAWGSGKNYDVKIGRISRDERFSKPIKQLVNTGYNTQPYMASSPSYLLNMAAKSDKAIHDDLRVNHDIQIPHAYLEKPYVGFSDRNYKFMKNRKPPGIGPNPIEAAGKVAPISEETGHWVQQFDQNYWQPVEVSEDWIQHLDNNDWDATPYRMEWDTDHWQNNTDTGIGVISVDEASWRNEYRPTHIRITFTGSISKIGLRDPSHEQYIATMNNPSSPVIATCDFVTYGTDIDALYLEFSGDITITNIEFYIGNILWKSTVPYQWGWYASSGNIKVHDQSNWANNFRPKKIRFTIIGDGNTQTVYLRDKNSNNIMIKNITPSNGVATKYTFNLNWHKAGDIDTFGFTTSNTVSIRNIEFLALSI